MEPSDQMMKSLTEAENAAESVLAGRAQIIELDRTRNKVREAARVISKTKDKKVWLCMGGTFVKVPSKTAEKMMRSDLDEIDNDVSKLRHEMKGKVENLRDIENKDKLTGFNLNPLTKEEMRGLENIL